MARALADGLVATGDRVCVLGFTSVDYTTIDIALGRVGAVSVPLQNSAAITQLQPILLETEPSLFAVSVDYLSDAVDVILSAADAGHAPAQLLIFDYRGGLDDDREALQSATERLSDLDITIETLNEIREHGAGLPALTTESDDSEDPLALLIYTSGSTGAPKGAMYPQSNVAKMWNRSTKNWFGPSAASITMNFMPMSHVMGRGILYGTLGNGGTAYFAAKSDLSTLLEDLRLVRPTELNFVPRIWEMLFHEYSSEVGRRTAEGLSRDTAEAQVLAEVRDELLGGRFIFAMTGSAPTSTELRTWVELLIEMPLLDGYGSTEAGMVLFDGWIQRPPVVDYKLADVPDLGYFSTDRPHPRGELLLKTNNMFPGYYKRAETTAGVFDPDGYYRTGDVFAEVEPATIWSTSTAATTCSSWRKANSSRWPSWRRCSATARWSSRSTFTATARSRTCWQLWCPPMTPWSATGKTRRSRHASPSRCKTLPERRTCSPTRSRATSSSRPRRSPWRTVC